MEKTLSQLLMDYHISKGWVSDNSNEDLYTTFEECCEVVYQSEPDRHRWFTLYDVVRAVPLGNGTFRYFEDVMWDIHGESSGLEDCGWKCPDIGSIVEVYPVEVKAIKYVRNK